jgi:hypothetical protein
VPERPVPYAERIRHRRRPPSDAGSTTPAAGGPAPRTTVDGGGAQSRSQAPHVVPLTAVASTSGGTPRATFRAGPQRLVDRMMYDLLYQPTEGHADTAVAHHAVYARKEWATFGIAHATDLHIAARNDALGRRLRELGFPEGARSYSNFNNNFRDFVRWANRQHDAGKLDVIMATGDLVDYCFEDGDRARQGPGNFGLFEQIVLGDSPYADDPGTEPAAEELCVPILTSLGNHDYRENAYPFVFDLELDLGLLEPDIQRIPAFDTHNLTYREAIALVGGRWIIPGSSPEARFPIVDAPSYQVAKAATFASFDPGIVQGTGYYFRRINAKRSYAQPLGGSKHYLVMLDTGHDLGVVDDFWRGIEVLAGYGTEDEETFMAGSPNSEGVRQSEVDLVTRTPSRPQGTTGL